MRLNSIVVEREKQQSVARAAGRIEEPHSRSSIARHSIETSAPFRVGIKRYADDSRAIDTIGAAPHRIPDAENPAYPRRSGCIAFDELGLNG